jgi:hypothetical protein
MVMVTVMSVDLLGAGVQQASSPLNVISAQRAKSYATASSEFKARDEVADVVIVVRVGGLSREEFRRIRQDTIYAMAGDERLPPSVVLTGVIEGKDELKAVFVGPKALLEMRLVLGDYPPITFTSEQAIADQLR